MLTPAELMKAILRAPVDLFWNGGIGTYVKSAEESNADVGDKANDAIRIDGADLRCRVVGEGGNLGFTQLGRIEASQCGVRINTDAIDNSAGVDTSDHEVNIKILLDQVVRAGDLTTKQRNELLATMTDDVAAHVLRDNYEQNVLLGNARVQAHSMLTVHQRFIRDLERRGDLDRALEFLPSDSEIDERHAAGLGLTSPEFSVLVAYSKMTLAEDLLASELPDEPWYGRALRGYFPPKVVELHGDRLDDHPLRREIVTTTVVNDLVNRGGITFSFRAVGGDGRDARGDRPRLLGRPRGLRPRDVLGPRRGARHARAHRRADRAVPRGAPAARPGDAVAAPGPPVRGRRARRDRALRAGRGTHPARAQLPARRRAGAAASAGEADFEGLGAPADLAPGRRRRCSMRSRCSRSSRSPRATGEPPETVGQIYFALSERFDVDRMLTRITLLPRDDRWSALARMALRYDLYAALAALTRSVQAAAPEGDRPRRADRRVGGAELRGSGPGPRHPRPRSVMRRPSTWRPCRWRCAPCARWCPSGGAA